MTPNGWEYVNMIMVFLSLSWFVWRQTGWLWSGRQCQGVFRSTIQTSNNHWLPNIPKIFEISILLILLSSCSSDFWVTGLWTLGPLNLLSSSIYRGFFPRQRSLLYLSVGLAGSWLEVGWDVALKGSAPRGDISGSKKSVWDGTLGELAVNWKITNYNYNRTGLSLQLHWARVSRGEGGIVRMKRWW